jgi:hypothetical protein
VNEIMAEIRRIREEIAKEYDYDVGKFMDAMREKQGRDGRQVVKREPRRKAPPSVVPTAEK